MRVAMMRVVVMAVAVKAAAEGMQVVLAVTAAAPRTQAAAKAAAEADRSRPQGTRREGLRVPRTRSVGSSLCCTGCQT